MEVSPLTQQSRPETFKPKIVQLYEALFQTSEDAEPPSEGFWREFFLLPPDSAKLASALDVLSPDETLGLQDQTQCFFARAIREAGSGNSPTDSFALDTLTVFLASILKKKYTNPSSDIITILAGLDEVDHVTSDFVAVLDSIIRSNKSFDIRLKSIKAAIAMTSGAYKTNLVSYFIHRDLFPALMKFIHESEHPIQIFEPFVLLGILANYSKFEFQNPYQLRLEDFVNESSIQKIVKGVGLSCAALRNGYVAVQDDKPEGWTLSSTLIFFSLRSFAPGARDRPARVAADEAKQMFAALPAQEASVLLATYDFANANKLFGYHLINLTPEKSNEESPFSSFLSLTSYLLQHAHRSPRVAHYAALGLFTLRILTEDPTLCKQLCSEDVKRKVRLCRQRPPHPPLVNGERVLATAIFDIVIDTISHNLQRRLDTNLYSHSIAILLRVLTYLSFNKIRLAYHWSEMWRTLLSVMRFLTSYASDLADTPYVFALTNSLADLIAFCVSAGDTFLPDPSSYDDLFYKIVETGATITRFRDAYSLGSCPKSADSTGGIKTKGRRNTAIDTLISVSAHFHSLLFHGDANNAADDTGSRTPEQTGTAPLPVSQKKNLNPREVHRIIKLGYDTLSIQPPDGLHAWTKWRETDLKSELKRSTRYAVEDARQLVAQV